MSQKNNSIEIKVAWANECIIEYTFYGNKDLIATNGSSNNNSAINKTKTHF